MLKHRGRSKQKGTNFGFLVHSKSHGGGEGRIKMYKMKDNNTIKLILIISMFMTLPSKDGRDIVLHFLWEDGQILFQFSESKHVLFKVAEQVSGRTRIRIQEF